MNEESTEANKRGWQGSKNESHPEYFITKKKRLEKILVKKNIPSISGHLRIATFDFKFLHVLLFRITFFKQLC